MPHSSRPSLPPPPELGDTPEGFDDSAWLDVIHKMDEVYQQLVRDEVALEEKNTELEQPAVGHERRAAGLRQPWPHRRNQCRLVRAGGPK